MADKLLTEYRGLKMTDWIMTEKPLTEYQAPENEETKMADRMT